MSADGTPRFEGSYGGQRDRIGEAAVLECKICWTVYDPRLGDETRQIPPGTAFRDLPGDWTCPECGGDPAQFMVLSDGLSVPAASAEPVPDASAPPSDIALRAAVSRLEAAFREVHNAKMRDTPLTNKALHVEAIGFREWEGRFLGVLVAPWFMNLVLLPGPGEDWSALAPGAKELISFPSGVYEFIHNAKSDCGGFKGCSLFSPMSDFASQLQATDVARAVMLALFDEKNRAETARTADIRASAEAEEAARAAAEAPPPRLADAPSRRAVLTGGIASETPSDAPSAPEKHASDDPSEGEDRA